MAGWSLDLNQWVDKEKQNILDVRRSFAFALFAKILYRTPVDSGRARQNWIVTLNGGSLAYNPNAAKGGMVFADGRKMIYNAKGDDTIIIQNNAPYIGKLEYGGYGPNSPSGKTVNGFSKQAPHGMVGVTMLEAGATMTEAIAEVGK
jgi:hypothetical protein